MTDKTSPSTTVNKNAQNPMGQSHTMKGATGVFNPPNQSMHSSKNIHVPVSGDRAKKKHG